MELESESALKKTYWNTVIHSVITFMGQSLMQLVDLLFCGTLGSLATATVGTATALYAWFMIVGIGLVLSLEYWIPHSLGEKQEAKAHSFYYSGILVAFLVSAFSTFGYWLMAQNTAGFGTNPEIQASVTSFANILAWSYLPVFLVPTLRVELQARGHPHDTTYAFAIGNVLNVFLNWALIHGHAGLPALGLNGCAWANLISRFGILFYLLIKVNRVRKGLGPLPIRWQDVSYLTHIRQILKMGMPISLQMFFEMGAFIIVGMLAAKLSTAQNAAHSITISIATFLFMIPLGLSSAAALTLSKLNGEKRHSLAIHYGWSTLRLGLLYAIIGSGILLIFQKWVLGIYTQDVETIEISGKILLIAAFFQIGDASQVILAGCLRGFGKSKTQAIVNGVGHWMIGLPLGLFCATVFNWQVFGLWIGLCAGLFSVAIGLLYFWKKAIQEPAEQIEKEATEIKL